jgi:hypothetical protein
VLATRAVRDQFAPVPLRPPISMETGAPRQRGFHDEIAVIPPDDLVLNPRDDLVLDVRDGLSPD